MNANMIIKNVSTVDKRGACSFKTSLPQHNRAPALRRLAAETRGAVRSPSPRRGAHQSRLPPAFLCCRGVNLKKLSRTDAGARHLHKAPCFSLYRLQLCSIAALQYEVPAAAAAAADWQALRSLQLSDGADQLLTVSQSAAAGGGFNHSFIQGASRAPCLHRVLPATPTASI